MKDKDVIITFLGLVISQIILLCLMFFFFGVEHPFSNLYQVGRPLLFILSAIVIMIPLYMIFGYIFIVGRNQRTNLQRSLVFGCLYYALALMVIWALANILTITNIAPNAWEIYVIANFPTAVIINSIDIAHDALNPLFLLTAIAPSLFFGLGGYLRIRRLKIKELIES